MAEQSEKELLKKKAKALWSDKRTYANRLVLSGAAMFAACFTFIFFGPFEMVAFGGRYLVYTYLDVMWLLLGAMAAVQPTFKDSLESCLTQIVGVFLGGLAGILLVSLPLYPLVAVGIGMVLVITFYNLFHIRYSPSLPCFIVVMVCTTPATLMIWSSW